MLFSAPQDCITGPIIRGDWNLVDAQLEVLPKGTATKMYELAARNSEGNPMKIQDFDKRYNQSEKKPITMITSYDAFSAKTSHQAGVDCILVGDSVGMVVYGFDSTLQVTTEMIVRHTEAVRRAAPDSFIIADMPFMSNR